MDELTPAQIAAYSASQDRVVPGANAPQIDWERARRELSFADFVAFASIHGAQA